MSIGTRAICLACVYKAYEDDGEQERSRVLYLLAERVRIGREFGNDRAVNYPAGLDYHLTRTLDALRHYLIQTRITLASDDINSEPTQIVEGHLRRFGPLDGQPDDYGLNDDLLGLFANPDDAEPHASLADDDYRQIVQIEIVDPLLQGRRRDPLVVWTASDEQTAKFSESRQVSLRRERRRAKLLVLHLVVLVTVWVALLIPVVVAYAHADRWRTFGWLVNFILGAFLSGMTLPMWETFPSLRLLWGDNLDEKRPK